MATQTDIDKLYDVFSEVDTLHQEAHPEVFHSARYTNTIKEYYKTCIQDPSMMIFLAAQNELICGAIICTLHTTPENPILVARKYAMIENIAVRNQFTRQKVGQRLMERTHQWAKTMGAGSIELTVWNFNQGAKDFYYQMGYKTKHIRMNRDLR
jgi:diamine N-acetyltransferase